MFLYRSVNIVKRLGGEGLSPFYSFIKGGKNGWLFNEMQDLFYYAQILQQGENTIETRKISGMASIKQIPNLMRAVGYFPSNKEVRLSVDLYYLTTSINLYFKHNLRIIMS